jgi:hypothetical protein
MPDNGVPFVQRQKKRLAVGDPIKLTMYNDAGDQVLYSGKVTGVAGDGKSLDVIIRTEEGLTELKGVRFEP